MIEELNIHKWFSDPVRQRTNLEFFGRIKRRQRQDRLEKLTLQRKANGIRPCGRLLKRWIDYSKATERRRP